MQSRRTFLAASASGAALFPVLIQGCGLKRNAADAASGLADADDFADVPGVISANHGHLAMISVAELQAGAAVTLDIQGTGTHGHAVTLTEQNIATLRAGQPLTISSGQGGGHAHTVTFTPVFGIDGEVATNHGHRAYLSPAAFQITVSIRGNGTHDHVVSLSVDQLVKIRDGAPVTVASSTVGGHAHSVVFNPPPPPSEANPS